MLVRSYLFQIRRMFHRGVQTLPYSANLWKDVKSFSLVYFTVNKYFSVIPFFVFHVLYRVWKSYWIIYGNLQFDNLFDFGKPNH